MAVAAARLCLWLNTPIPWMIGPLVATALVSVAGAPTTSWVPLRNSGQWVIGTALGLYFTPAVGTLVTGLWWAIALGIVWSLALGLGFGAWLRRVHGARLEHLGPAQLRSTTYFAGAIGGASEMTLIAERHGARTDLVASAHSLRVLLVTLTIPFAMQAWGVSGLDPAPPGAREVSAGGLLLLGGVTLAGAWLMRWLGRGNPWFMGALLVTMVLTLSGVTLSAIPPALSAAAQLVIGVSLGGALHPGLRAYRPALAGLGGRGHGAHDRGVRGICLVAVEGDRPASGDTGAGDFAGRDRRDGHHRQGAAAGRADGDRVSGLPAGRGTHPGRAGVPVVVGASGLGQVTQRLSGGNAPRW